MLWEHGNPALRQLPVGFEGDDATGCRVDTLDDPDLAAAERSAAGGGLRLLLTHSPEYWEQFVEGRQPIDVTLAGHTHGAQVGIGIRPIVWSPAALRSRPRRR